MAKAKSTATKSATLGADLAAQVTGTTPAPAPAVASKSAKQFIRELLGVAGTQMSVAELCKASNKTTVNVVTALSDLRSVKYAGKAGVFKTVAVKRADGTTAYQVAK